MTRSVAALLGAVALLQSAALGAASFKGKEFPNFDATDAISREKFALADLRGKVVLVDFWATWCGPCVQELPNVKRAWSKYRQRGLEIVSISLDSDRSRFESFVRAQKMDWRHVMDGGGWGTRLAKKYGINSIPQMFLIGTDGKCVGEDLRGPALERAIEQALPPTIEDKKTDPKPDPKLDPKPDPKPKAKPKPKPDPAKPDLAPPKAPAPAPAKSPAGLAEARRTLDDVAAPLPELRRRLDGVASRLETAQRDQPAPQQADQSARRLALIYTDLGDLRHELFMRGVIDPASAVPLPAKPQTGAVASSGAVPKLMAAVQGLQAAVDTVSGQVRELEGRLSRLEREPGSAASAAAETEARAMIDRLGGAWVSRLDSAAAMIDSCCRPLDEASARLDSIGAQIADLRAALQKAPTDTGDLMALRDRFAALCDAMSAAAAAPEACVPPPALPKNPLGSRRLKDRRALTEAEGQLQVADAAVAAMRQALTAARAGYADLATRNAALREEVAKRQSAGGSVSDLEPRFAELSRAVLALRDA